MKTKQNLTILGLLGFAAASTVLSLWAVTGNVISLQGWMVLNLFGLTALVIAAAAYFANK